MELDWTGFALALPLALSQVTCGGIVDDQQHAADTGSTRLDTTIDVSDSLPPIDGSGPDGTCDDGGRRSDGCPCPFPYAATGSPSARKECAASELNKTCKYSELCLGGRTTELICGFYDGEDGTSRRVWIEVPAVCE